MEELSENADRIRTLLSQFSKGTTAKELKRITQMSRATVYEALKELSSKGYVANEKRKWTIKEKQSSFWKNRSERKRLEREQQRKLALAQKWTYLELLAKLNPEFEAAKEWVNIEKKNYKEMDLE